ncbi:MAG: dual specificity protein phosphatase family protein [Coxiellaceae bacterium]|nr:dual specificity protein phosphatase family protein [Coxiellaceae bacterium]
MVAVIKSAEMPSEQQYVFGAIAMFFIAAYRDPLFLLRVSIIREIVSLMSIAVVGWRSGPSYPYISHFGKLTLGGMPYEGSDLERKIAKRSGMVVSMLKPFEAEGHHLERMGHAKPTQMAFWTTHGVSYQHIPMQDMSVEVRNQDALETLRAMNNCIKGGKRVYLHCQAGQGRSFIMRMAYLLAYGYPFKANDHRRIGTYEDALRIVKRERPQVDATAKRRKKIEEIVALFKEQQNTAVASYAALA